MRGRTGEPQLVVLRGFGGVAYTAWIVSVAENAVYVTDDEGLKSVLSGHQPSRVMGCRREDVFEQDRAHPVRQGDLPDWSALTPWKSRL
jgi:hypothetical protein